MTCHICHDMCNITLYEDNMIIQMNVMLIYIFGSTHFMASIITVSPDCMFYDFYLMYGKKRAIH